MQEKENILSKEVLALYRDLYAILNQYKESKRILLLKEIIGNAMFNNEGELQYTNQSLCFEMETALLVLNEIGLSPSAFFAIMLYPMLSRGLSFAQIKKDFGEEVAIIVEGLKKVNDLSKNNLALESENYVKLLLSMAEDVRVVFIILAQQLVLMRNARNIDTTSRLDLCVGSKYLYAPLAHRLGLYSIKSELEDLSLKYTDRETYDFIAGKLNETKKSRDKYIKSFIEPLKEQIDKLGFKYEIKGRTKSIHSINNKLKKQKVEFENIYDLFAIRLVLDVSHEQEKAQCWQVYSVVTDMYQPNPKRFKDWLSIPKSNGYESLHITVMGHDSKWVEVQIRSKRMDEIAERGLAAHWKYKGVKSESEFDHWLHSLRDSLDSKETNMLEKMGDFKLDLYDEEIFVFTPKGELLRFPKGATVLDFAFAIHSKLGATCSSGRVNGRNVPIKYILKSGDQVEINTSPSQSPKQDWLNFVVTSKAKTRIRQLLKESTAKQVDIAKETLLRRFKNRKIDLDDSVLMQLIKKLKYKTITDFYVDIANQKLDLNSIIDQYLDLLHRVADNKEPNTSLSAEEFVMVSPKTYNSDGDGLIIDEHLTGVDYKLAKCCNPIYGDDIFGFVSSQGIKIHRLNCPNAPDLFSRFGYRVVKASWSGTNTGSASYTASLRVIGNDQLNIVANLMSIISKENDVSLRAITIDSVDGLFQGNITVMLPNTLMLEQLMKKLRVVKGVKSVTRLN